MRDHLLINDYLPTKFEALRQSIHEILIAQGVEDWPINWHVQNNMPMGTGGINVSVLYTTFLES